MIVNEKENMMRKTLKDHRPVYVVGIGLHRYQPMSDKSYVELGLAAIREALEDAKIIWHDVESSYIATTSLGMASGRVMMRHLGASGAPLVHIENASASGSSAFRQACLEVASGFSDTALAVGVDKPYRIKLARERTGIDDLTHNSVAAFSHFALIANEYMHKHKIKPEQIAKVAVKNHRNGSLNPYAHRQKERTLDEIISESAISGSLKRLECCPVGEGASAVIVASEEGIKRLGIDPNRAIRVTASTSRSEKVLTPGADIDTALTKETAAIALKEAGVDVKNVDVFEFHEAFSIEELLYIEALGICKEGTAVHFLEEGVFDIGGKHAISASGGLIAMGHPLGPTGIGQIVEVTRQLRHEAGARQQPNAKIGLAHMLGLGSVCIVHILERP